MSSKHSSKALRRHTVVAAAIAVVVAAFTTSAQKPSFYPDDPIAVDDDMSLDASKVAPVEDSNGYDFVVNTFGDPGVEHDVRAGNVNTIDEVPDSSWFVNRIGKRPMSTEEIVRGPDRVPSISFEGWRVSGGKSAGLQPGFRMTDPSGQLYQIELDPPSNPEMATGAEIIGTAFYHALGYHTVDVYLAELDPARLEIGPTARISDPRIGGRRPLSRRDVNDVLRRSARMPNGNYRVLVSRFADGAPLGNFRYYGRRSDDPNDLVPHEDRRELRGARVFGAWLNHDDSRGVNSLDMLQTDGARRYVKHYMFDFGSIMGSGTVFAQRHRAGNEYIVQWKPGWLTLLTFGAYTRSWMHIDYPDVPPAVGRFEAASFDAAAWRPEYPNPAFKNMRADDAFWAARLVARFSPADIRAVVQKARYGDPRATDYITATLVERRKRVLETWLSAVNPLVDFALSDQGVLTFGNAAVAAGMESAATSHRVRWSRFDNTTGAVRDTVETEMPGSSAPAPTQLLTGAEFLQLEVSAEHPRRPEWRQPVTVHFRRAGNGWALVGVQRLP
jgi:hypothetical protein